MVLDQLRSKLISFGYRSEEVEYTLARVLEYKKRDYINRQDFRILLSMLQERIELERAFEKRKKKNLPREEFASTR